MFLQDLKQDISQDPKLLEAQRKLWTDIFYRIGRMIYEERLRQGMTQQELASKLKTKQPDIAEIENGNRNISLGYLNKIAKTFNTRLIPPQFESLVKVEESYNSKFFNRQEPSLSITKTENNLSSFNNATTTENCIINFNNLYEHQ